ncbi:hypothetical protein A2U01_0077575, partial [Trifolium medium]|nr:hypothetical protein [Trifolium medium]
VSVMKRRRDGSAVGAVITVIELRHRVRERDTDGGCRNNEGTDDAREGSCGGC